MVAVASPAEELPSPFWLHDAVSTVRALDALVEVGVVNALTATPASSDELARRLDLDRRPLDLALDVADRAGLLHADGGRWTVDPSVELLLRAGHGLAGVLRGAPPGEDVSDAANSGRIYPSVVRNIARISHAVAGDVLPILRSPGQTVVEIAAGAAPWGCRICDDDPAAAVTAIDLPGVIDVTRAAVEAAGHTERFRLVAADVFEVDSVDPADLIVVAGFCRLLGEEQNRALFRKLASWAADGGRVAVIDAVATPEARAQGLAGYELNLLTRTARGRCWSLDHYARWLTDAGFAHIELTTTARPEISVVTAERNEHR